MQDSAAKLNWLQKIRHWVNDPDRLYSIHKLAFALYVPIFLIAVFGKIERKRFDGEASVDTILLLAPEFIFYSLVIIVHILIFRALKPLGIKLLSLSALVVFGVIWLNFLAVEILGNVYGITTSNSDFDYSLILYSFSQMGDLFAVFMSVLEPVMALSSIFLLILYPIYLIYLLKEYSKCSLETTLGDKQAIKVFGVLSLLPALYLATVGAGRMDDVPLPLSISAIDRSISSKIETMSALTSPPIRQQFARDAMLVKIDPEAVPPNLVVIVLESTRHLSTLGREFGNQVTPFMNSLKDKSIVFDRAYAIVPHTSKSIESIYCSVEPKQGLALVAANPIVGIPSKCMAGFLKDIGYNNIFISTAPSSFEDRITFLKNASFDEYILGEDMEPGNFSKVNYFGYEDKVMLSYTKKWLENNGDTPFFMSLLTITPHHDYIVPSTYESKDFSSNQSLNDYLNTLAYQDEFLHELITTFEEAGRADNTLFVIVGDHGEAFGEHGRLMHDTVLYDEGIRVPLMFYGAGVSDPTTYSKSVSLIDIMPTAFAKMGLSIASGESDVIGGVDAQTRDKNRPVFSYCYREQLCSLIIKGDWKLIYHHGYSKNELFNLQDDAGEKINLVESDPERAQAMQTELLNWLASVRSYNQHYFKSKIGKE